MDIIKDFNDAQKLDENDNKFLDEELKKYQRIEGRIRTKFSDEQYTIIKNFWKILIFKYSEDCFITLFGKLTKKLTEMHQ